MRTEAEIRALLDAVKAIQRANLACPHWGAVELAQAEDTALYKLENTLAWILGVPIVSDHTPNKIPPEPAIFPLMFILDGYAQRMVREACPDNTLIQREFLDGEVG